MRTALYETVCINIISSLALSIFKARLSSRLYDAGSNRRIG